MTSWYPEYEDYEILWAASLITTWLFIWDDYVDSNDGSLAKDFDRATAWRAEALSSARQFLGLDESVTEPKTPTGPMIVLAEYARLIKPRLNRGKSLDLIPTNMILYQCGRTDN